MKKSARSQRTFWCLLPSFTRYSLILLLSGVLLSESVGATPERRLQIAQQAKRGYSDSFAENIPGKVPASVNITSLQLQIAQSPATKPQNAKPALSPEEAKIKPLTDKASQLFKEAIELARQPSAASQRQAITKLEEALKIWRLPEIRAVIPQKARYFEATTLDLSATIYSELNENTKALGYVEQALAIWRELKDRLQEARTLMTFSMIYGFNLTEYTKAVGYVEQALAILRESKEPEARSLQGLTLSGLGEFYRQLGEKQKAIDAYNQAQSLYHADNQPKEEAEALSGLAGVYGRFGEPKKQREYLDQALAIHKANNDLPEQASTLTFIALNYQKLGETEKALDYHQQALKIYRQTKDLFEQARTLNSIGLVYSSRGDRPSAEKYIQQGLELQKTVQRQLGQDVKSQRNQIIILKSIAISYLALGDTQQTIVYLKQAQIIAHELGRTQDEAELISSIGQAYYSLGETQKANENFTQALKLQTEIKDFQGKAKTLVNIASIHTKSGEFQEALNRLNEALEISKQKQNSDLEGGIIFEMSNVYRNLGAYELSIEKSKEVLAIYQQSNPSLVRVTLSSIGVAYLASCFYQKKPEDCHQALDYSKQALISAREQGSVSDEITNLGNMTKAYELLQDYPQAIENGEKALELSRKYNLKDHENSALTFLTAAYERAGDHQKALDASKQSLLLSQQLGDLTSLATVYKAQGIIYTSMKQPQLAIEAYNQQLKLAKQIGDISYQTFPLYKIAIIERDRGNFNQAKTHIETVIGIVENTRSKVTSQDLRSSYFATVQDYYQFYIDLLMQLHKKDPSKGYNAQALHISERSRARGLIELLTEARANIRKGVDPKLLAEEKRLQQLIDARGKLRFDIVNSDKIKDPIAKVSAEKLQKEVETLLTQQKELQTKIRTSSPKYGNLIYPEPLKLSQIQQQLDKDTLLLEYSLGEERSYLWAVTPNSIDSYELPPRKQIEEAATKFKNDLQQPRGGDLTALSATKLSKLILAPVADKLGQKRLVIVADGALQTIPFAALNDLTPQPLKVQGKGEQDKLPSPMRGGVGGEVNYQPLIVNHEIVNLPSVTAIATQRVDLKGRKSAPKTLAVLADPVFEANDERITGKPAIPVPNSDFRGQIEQSDLKRGAKNLNRNVWERIEGTSTEAKAILDLIPSSNNLQAFGFDANYNWVTNKQLSQYRFLHFATHGFADPNNPELSGIVLSLFLDKQAKPADRGYLRLGDIFNLDFTADLVVLSACDTGLGKNVNGEGLVGLTRGLMYAGAERVAVSLWQVNDDGTAKLMQEFYTEMLKQGKSPTVALRAAQMKLWQDQKWQNPYYWSAFTLQGEWR
ncbi:CHAT domain-containing protein [Hassallia byssoidea VB512170]|uniref:CHAT domain-containing protein n=1 Tax=Hassallia byssoidea VB512170 TaxID=1304833 RepID=A0A846HFW9_9CYAN|nr:CHAT domain-containing protein [Hassalia byssoidea]NEU76225.1 CHAT domain-containing protein [Hassalia byssoidea VB512170]